MVLILGGVGALIAVWAREQSSRRFLSLWSVGLLAAYSLVGYKTPWISLKLHCADGANVRLCARRCLSE